MNCSERSFCGSELSAHRDPQLVKQQKIPKPLRAGPNHLTGHGFVEVEGSIQHSGGHRCVVYGVAQAIIVRTFTIKSDDTGCGSFENHTIGNNKRVGYYYRTLIYTNVAEI